MFQIFRQSYFFAAGSVVCWLFMLGVVSLSAHEKPLVVVTTSIVADTVRAVAGNRCEVKALMGPGVDPHLYKASHGDLTLLSKAQLIFYNGLHLEGKMQEALEALKKRKPVHAVSDGVNPSKLRQPKEFAGQYDPHIWFDIQLWIDTVAVVSQSLATLLPQYKAEFELNAQTYRQQLTTLHDWVLDQVQQVPQAQRVLITAHDAFGYFGRAYGFQVAGLQGISTVSEFGLQDVQRIVDLVLERKIKAIFVESSVPERFVASIQQGVMARGAQVAIGGTLYSDALGDSASGAASYQGMVRKNIDTIVKALR
jgi:manganese/zinc/iron transport system substrate-binding protein